MQWSYHSLTRNLMNHFENCCLISKNKFKIFNSQRKFGKLWLTLCKYYKSEKLCLNSFSVMSLKCNYLCSSSCPCVKCHVILICVTMRLWNPSGYVLTLWEEVLHSKASSHWLSPYPKWSLRQVCVIGRGHKSIRADSRFVSSQWETSFQINTISHWLGANLKAAL